MGVEGMVAGWWLFTDEAVDSEVTDSETPSDLEASAFCNTWKSESARRTDLIALDYPRLVSKWELVHMYQPTGEARATNFAGKLSEMRRYFKHEEVRSNAALSRRQQSKCLQM